MRDVSFPIMAQPDEETCGATALHGLYRFFGERLELDEVIASVPRLDEGGTLGPLLGLDALKRGYSATLYTFNLKVFDPTWFDEKGAALPELEDLLGQQLEHKTERKLQRATRSYRAFLRHGGQIRFEDLTTALLRRHLKHGRPILCGLSATYLYRSARELPDCSYDALRGSPCGHFVILTDYDSERRLARVADPLHGNPVAGAHHYDVPLERLVGAIFLGVMTYDANLTIITPAAT